MHTSLARVSPSARFVPHDRLAGTPHVVVDGPLLPGTALALSHWPAGRCPPELAADTSTAIVDRYLGLAHGGPEVEVVTNNHYDEDGVLGVWMLLTRPPAGSAERRLALAAAEAGDFGTWTDPDAARVALAVMALAERGTSPLPAVGRALAPGVARDPCGALYEAVLPRIGRLLADPDRHRRLWEPGWRRVEEDLALIDGGAVGIEEREDADVAIVRTPRPLRDMALHVRTRRMRVLTCTPDGVAVLRHRYETWVRYVSRPLVPRHDLTGAAAALTAREPRAGTWRFEGVDAIRARLYLAGDGGRAAPTGLDPHEICDAVAAPAEVAA